MQRNSHGNSLLGLPLRAAQVGDRGRLLARAVCAPGSSAETTQPILRSMRDHKYLGANDLATDPGAAVPQRHSGVLDQRVSNV